MLKIEKIKITPKTIGEIVMDPGIYIFWDKRGVPLYVGKSKSLRDRVKSYFLKNLSPKTSQMISESEYVSTIRVNSELEALLLEARLVKRLQTRFNSQLKDDKHPFYIRLTDEEFPQVLTARKIDDHQKNMAFFGPFPSTNNVKNVLKMLRRLFPYAQHKPGKRGCLYSQLGLCSPCPSEIIQIKDKKTYTYLKKKYRKNVSNINLILSGKLNKLRASLEREMTKYSQEEKFEEASLIHNQIKRLDYVTQPITPIHEFLQNPNLIDDVRRQEILELKKLLTRFTGLPYEIKRIECYDVSHISGTNPAASMVTFEKGEPAKNYYRHFRIRQGKGGDDLASLKEVIGRRLTHLSDWGTPDLLVVDGGRTQVAIFWGEARQYKIPVIGLAKRLETLVIPYSTRTKLAYKEIILPKGPALNLLQRMRDEAHRFARKYHHGLVQKELLPDPNS